VDSNKGEKINEPLDWPATPEHTERAKQWAELITLEMKMGKV
jgi:integrase